MAANTQANRRRAFADVVTVEAWHDNFTDNNSEVDLHADVVFGTARVGGETDSPVRFRLSVKRAEVVIIIPELEPVAVDRRSVSRDSPEVQGCITETRQRSSKGDLSAGVSLSGTQEGLQGSLTAKAAGQKSASTMRTTEVSEAVRLIIVTQSKTDEGHYRWLLEPSLPPFLKGRPWDPAKQPRLRLIDNRKDRSKGIPPSVRVEVRCRKEDLHIEDLRVKDEGLWETLRNRVGFTNRLAAAESYIRERLLEEGLEVENMDDIFGQITLGSAMAQPT